MFGYPNQLPDLLKTPPSSLRPLSPLILRPQLPTDPPFVPPLRVRLQRSIHRLPQLPDLPHRHLHTPQQHQRIHLSSSPFLHQTYFPLRIRRYHYFTFAALLLHQRRVCEPFSTRFEKVECHTERVVEQGERYRVALQGGVDD